MTSTLDQLKKITNLSTEQLLLIEPHIRTKHIKAEENFILVGDSTQHIGIVMSGLFRFYYITYDGREVTKSFCAEHDFLGVYSSYLTNQPAPYTIQALEDSHILTLPFNILDKLSQEYMEWLQIRLNIIEQLYLKKEQRERQLLQYDAMTRYQQFCDLYPDIESRVKQYHIASYLGISPVSLSRLRSKLNSNFNN